MYQVQVKDQLDSDWANVGEPTVSYREAANTAGNLHMICHDTRVVCTDDAASGA